MPSIKYLGPTTNDIDVLNRLRLQSEIAGTLTPAMVDQQITTALSPKANSYYLGNKSAQYVTTAAMSGRGATLINKSSEVNVPGGPVALSGGRIPASRLPNPHSSGRTGGKSWLKLVEYSSSNFNILSGVHNSTSERAIGNFTLNGPSYPWYPIFAGDFSMSGGKGEICIKQGSRVVARAVSGNVGNVWWTCSIVPMDSLVSYTGTVQFSITQRSFFGSTELSSGYRLTCLAIPA